MPEPMPFSCLPNGSGDPIALERIGCHSVWSRGRTSRLMIRPFDVPPRTKDAGNDFVVILATSITCIALSFETVGLHCDLALTKGRSRLFMNMVSKALSPYLCSGHRVFVLLQSASRVLDLIHLLRGLPACLSKIKGGWAIRCRCRCKSCPALRVALRFSRVDPTEAHMYGIVALVSCGEESQLAARRPNLDLSKPRNPYWR